MTYEKPKHFRESPIRQDPAYDRVENALETPHMSLHELKTLGRAPYSFPERLEHTPIVQDALRDLPERRGPLYLTLLQVAIKHASDDRDVLPRFKQDVRRFMAIDAEKAEHICELADSIANEPKIRAIFRPLRRKT